VHSGDFFGLVRMAGIDTLLAWGMGGSHTAHTTVAMRLNGELHVCESNSDSSNWPRNGIQCNKWQQWLEWCNVANNSVVWVPLSAESRAKFNETAAWEFINAHIDLDYGFANLLWGWVDGPDKNFPWPLVWQSYQLAASFLDKIAPELSWKVWNRAYNMRMGTENMTAAEIYDLLYQRGLTYGDLLTMPEQDDWMYVQQNNNNETVRARQMVCDVFVCEVWKSSGLFGDTNFQCTEATNWDVYTLNIFDRNFQLPSQCAQTDPGLPFCQLGGDYRLELPWYNSRGLYPNSFNNCPRGDPPSWAKPEPC